MFTKEDYLNYFNELEMMLKKSLVIYTDLLNELSDQSIANKLHALATEEMDIFKSVSEIKKKFI